MSNFFLSPPDHRAPALPSRPPEGERRQAERSSGGGAAGVRKTSEGQVDHDARKRQKQVATVRAGARGELRVRTQGRETLRG